MNELQSADLAEGLVFFSLFFLIVIGTVFYAVFRFLSRIELYLKVRKIKKLSEKQSLQDYTLKTNSKGLPILLVNRDDPSNIFIL